MLELFLKIIDRCIDITKRREEANKAFHTDFVAPLISDFEALHHDYLESFKKYRVQLLDTNTTLDDNHPIVSSISADSLFSDNLRAKVQFARPRSSALTQNVKRADPWLSEFVDSIADYLTCASSNPLNETVDVHQLRLNRLGVSNVIRSAFQSGLVTILRSKAAQQEKRQAAVSLLDGVVRELQSSYASVIEQHEKIKERLLKPL